jgi:excisionase family DNA binding protein
MSSLQITTPADLEVLAQFFDVKFEKVIEAITNQKVSQQNDETYLTKKEVSDLLKISLPTVNRRTKKGILKAYKLKGDTEKTAVRFKKSEVLEMLISVSLTQN